MATIHQGASAPVSGAPAPIPFQFGIHAVRVVVRDGAPWFVATDVCTALGYANPRDAVAKHLDHDERSTVANSDSRAGNGAQQFTIINESGLYALVLRSRKPQARRFAKWVTGEVLPSIRKTGGWGPAPMPEAPPSGRWLMHFDGRGAAQALALDGQAVVAPSWDGLARDVADGTALLSRRELTALALACMQRLAAREGL